MKKEIKIYAKSMFGKAIWLSFALPIPIILYHLYSSGQLKAMLEGGIEGNTFSMTYIPMGLMGLYMLYMYRSSIFKKPAVILDQYGITNQLVKNNIEYVQWSDVERVEQASNMGFPTINIFIKEDRDRPRFSGEIKDERRRETSVVQSPMRISVGQLKYSAADLMKEINKRKNRF